MVTLLRYKISYRLFYLKNLDVSTLVGGFYSPVLSSPDFFFFSILFYLTKILN